MRNISSIIDGITVEGEIIFRSQMKITVTITAPYSGLDDSSHIPTRGWASLPYSQGRYPERNFLLEYGDTEAVKILNRLFVVSKFIEDENNRKNLNGLLKEIDDAYKFLDDKTKEFHKFRKGLRIKLKSGEMSNKVFQELLGIFKKCLKKCKQECWDKEYEFRKALPYMSFDEKKIIAILRRLDNAYKS